MTKIQLVPLMYLVGIARTLMGAPDPVYTRPKVEGAYQNREYCYSVVVPSGYQVLRADVPAPAHGFVIRLRGGDDGTLSVDGSYNTLEYSSLEEAADSIFQSFGGTPTHVERASQTMGTLRGLRYSAVYELARGSCPRRQTGIVAFRSLGPNRPKLIYSIVLDTLAIVHPTYLGVLTALLKSFTLESLPAR